LFAPHEVDTQQPHAQEEIYIVAAGTGVFRRAAERVPFGPGDFLFVPAGVPHAFETFTDDFKTWVIFFGPKGGYGGGSFTFEGRLMTPRAGSVPAIHVFWQMAVIPGRAQREPGISRFRVRCFVSPRNDNEFRTTPASSRPPRKTHPSRSFPGLRARPPSRICYP
jgi:hypothetical protein